MNLHTMKVQPDGNKGEPGDAFRACLASLLNVEQTTAVPHYMGLGVNLEGAEDPWQAVDRFLRLRNLRLQTVAINADSLASSMRVYGLLNPDHTVMLTGKGEHGDDHVVLVRNGQIFHCPAGHNVPITGPASDGNYWLTSLAWRV